MLDYGASQRMEIPPGFVELSKNSLSGHPTIMPAALQKLEQLARTQLSAIPFLSPLLINPLEFPLLLIEVTVDDCKAPSIREILF